jgi:hypothetical protein
VRLVRFALLALPLLAACDGGKLQLDDDTAVVTDDTDSGDTDSGDTDSGDTGSGDTDTAVVTTRTLGFVLDGAADADTLQLDWLTEDFTILGRLGGATIAGGTVAVEVADPTEDDLLEIGAGLYGRYAIPYAFADDDGDGEHDADEAIGAVGRVWPLYLSGSIPIEYAALGLVEGWNALYVTESEAPDLYDIEAIPLPTNLAPVLQAELAGTVAFDVGADAQLALLPNVAFDGLPFGSLLYNQGLGAEWAIVVDGPPPDLHVTDLFGTGFDGALEVPVAWTDTDGDALPSGDEALLGPACLGAFTAALLWVAPPTDPLVAFYFASEGTPVGWSRVRTTGEDAFAALSDEEATSLVMGDGCDFE